MSEEAVADVSMQPAARSRRSEMLLAPTEMHAGFEVSVHTSPNILLRELQHVFPEQFQPRALRAAPVLTILTCQRALMDLSQFGDAADQEKNRLLETFVVFAKFVTTRLREARYWADYIDPCSGLPMLTIQSSKVYSEVDGVELLLRYRSLDAGICKILLHPRWGAAVYPASLFTTAPFDLVQHALEEFSRTSLQDIEEETQ